MLCYVVVQSKTIIQSNKNIFCFVSNRECNKKGFMTGLLTELMDYMNIKGIHTCTF